MLREEHLAVDRTARVATIGDASPQVRQLWIACHGYGQLAARFLRPFAAIAAPDRLIVAPEALNRFYLDGRTGPHGPDAKVGATWMTREDRLREIDDYVRYLDHVYDTMRGRCAAPSLCLVAFGFSQGVATICRWAARTAARIDDLVLWAGRLPPELEPRADLFAAARLHLVSGERDEFATRARLQAYTASLADAGLRFTEHRFAGGHEIDAPTLVRLADGLRSPAP